MDEKSTLEEIRSRLAAIEALQDRHGYRLLNDVSLVIALVAVGQIVILAAVLATRWL